MEINIPKQKEGGFSDTVSEIKFETVAEAALHFETVKKRFLDVNSWELAAGEEKAEFSLCDENGNEIDAEPEVQNYLRIKLPGIHNPTGDSFDWLQIETVEKDQSKDSEAIYIRVRPSENPLKKDGKTAHFFKNKATCNFLIKREENKISGEVHGRNEIPNNDDLTALEKIRNTLVSGVAIIVGSKFQWKSLTDGLIKNDEK